MSANVLVAVLIALVVAGCGGLKSTTPPPASEGSASAGTTPASTATPTEAPAKAPAATPAQATPGPPQQPAAIASSEKTAPPEPPPAKAVTQAPSRAAQQPAKKELPPAKKDTLQEPAKQNAGPSLDLASLETRLKETKAIGVMTKIALKNQVDDLLNQFRAFYAGKLKTTLAELRRPYDLLVLKVLALLQDGDPGLAAAIVASREAIWSVLSDPVKFANYASN